MIVDPINREEYVASRGYGATLNGKKIRVSSSESLQDGLVSAGIAPSNINQRLESYIKNLQEFTRACQAIRSTGSAALDLAYVASGKFDGFWHPSLKPWDMRPYRHSPRSWGFVETSRAGKFLSLAISWLQTQSTSKRSFKNC